MIRSLFVALVAVTFTSGALAQNCTVPNNLTNGTNADATQVMANFNALLACVNNLNNQNVARGYLSGLTLSTPGGSSGFAVTQGVAVSSDNTTSMQLSVASSKTSASWAAGSGNGALDSGSIANNTWYHVHLIKRPDTGVVDVLISLSATAPVMPTAHTLFRRIGSLKTDGSAHFLGFTQTGDTFIWTVGVRDINNLNIGTTATDLTLPSVPSGVVVGALGNAFVFASGAGTGANFYPKSVTDQATAYGTFMNVRDPSSGIGNVGLLKVLTNTSQTIRARGQTAGAIVDWFTVGWTDDRGKLN